MKVNLIGCVSSILLFKTNTGGSPGTGRKTHRWFTVLGKCGYGWVFYPKQHKVKGELSGMLIFGVKGIDHCFSKYLDSWHLLVSYCFFKT